MRVMNNNVLNGKRIVTQDGRVVGEIESLFVDVESWRVTDLSVKVRKDVLEELKLKRPFIGTQIIRIPTDQISGTSDQVVLRPAFSGMTYEGGEAEDAIELKPLFGEPNDDKGKDEKRDKKS